MHGFCGPQSAMKRIFIVTRREKGQKIARIANIAKIAEIEKQKLTAVGAEKGRAEWQWKSGPLGPRQEI
jgi:hypothetical protein